MYKHCTAFYPNHIYLGVNFNKIKKTYQHENKNFKDFGTLITISGEKLMISINSKGKTDVYYNTLDYDLISSEVKKIESLFKKQIEDFKLEEKYSYNF